MGKRVKIYYVSAEPTCAGPRQDLGKFHDERGAGIFLLQLPKSHWWKPALEEREEDV